MSISSESAPSPDPMDPALKFRSLFPRETDPQYRRPSDLDDLAIAANSLFDRFRDRIVRCGDSTDFQTEVLDLSGTVYLRRVLCLRLEDKSDEDPDEGRPWYLQVCYQRKPLFGEPWTERIELDLSGKWVYSPQVDPSGTRVQQSRGVPKARLAIAEASMRKVRLR